MKKITFLAALFIGATSMAQIASTSFEEPAVFTVQYVDTGDANVAHDLVDNADEPFVNWTSTGGEMGFNARYTPYDTPDVGLTDGDFVGVTTFAPSGDVGYTDGDQGFQISDTDGNFILEFDEVDLTGASAASVSIDFALSINGDGTNGNFEGDGTANESGSDRIRIYVKDLTNNTEIDIVNSTGNDLDDFVPTDSGTGNFIVQWQTGTANLVVNTTVQLVVEARFNGGSEVLFLDNVRFTDFLSTPNQAKNAFSMYPNPAKGFVNFTTAQEGKLQVSVFDVLGKELINTSITNKTLHIAQLTSGVYMVRITQGGLTETKKLIVK